MYKRLRSCQDKLTKIEKSKESEAEREFREQVEHISNQKSWLADKTQQLQQAHEQRYIYI